MNDPVNHPKHYTSSNAKCSKCGQPIECIDVTQHMNFNIGNAIKYIWRMELKNNSIEDLKKASWYINKEIERRKAEHVYVGHVEDCSDCDYGEHLC